MAEPQNASYELALANRKLVTVVMGMTLLMGLVACLAYLAGRSVTGIRSQQSAGPLPPPVIVEAPRKPVVPAKIIEVNMPAPVAAAVVAPPAAASNALYFQVAAGSHKDLAPFSAQLQGEGLPVRTVEIDAMPRLLVGPITSLDQQKEIDSKLTAAGRQHFPRRF